MIGPVKVAVLPIDHVVLALGDGNAGHRRGDGHIAVQRRRIKAACPTLAELIRPVLVQGMNTWGRESEIQYSLSRMDASSTVNLCCNHCNSSTNHGLLDLSNCVQVELVCRRPGQTSLSTGMARRGQIVAFSRQKRVVAEMDSAPPGSEPTQGPRPGRASVSKSRWGIDGVSKREMTPMSIISYSARTMQLGPGEKARGCAKLRLRS